MKIGALKGRWILSGISSLVLMLGISATAAQALELRYSDIGPPRGPRADVLQWWAEELKTRTNGRLASSFSGASLW